MNNDKPPLESHYRRDGDDLLLRVRISTRASRDQVGELMADRLKISITAPPVDGKASAHLAKFLSKQLGVAKSLVTIVAGETNRDKTIRVAAPTDIPACFHVAASP